MKPELRVALLGQGFMGRAHSNAYLQVGRFFDAPYRIRRKVICGRDAAVLDRMARDWDWEETATDWRTVIERKDIDLIDIALPNHLHAPVAIAAGQAGKMVLCEKPIANTVADAERMADACRARPNGVWFNYRRVPAIAYAQRLIAEGRLGTVYHYRATYLQRWPTGASRTALWKLDPDQAGSGVIGDLMSHLVDTALFLNGAIAEVNAMTRTFAEGRRIPDAVWAMAHFANGSEGSFEASRFATGCRNRNQFEIHDEGGMLRFNLEDMNRLEFLDARDPAPEQGLRSLLVTDPAHPYSGRYWKPGHIIGYEHTFISMLADFLETLRTGAPFHPHIDDACQVQRVLAAVERSASSRQWQSPADQTETRPVGA
jgi:predicted dehydrogenase